MARTEDFISEARQHATALFDSIYALIALQAEWNALDYGTGTNLPDGTGSNEGYTKTEVGAAVFDTANAMVTLLGQGHGTNLAKLL